MKILQYYYDRKRELERRKCEEDAKKVISGISTGLIIGTVLGILFAPKSGKETRKAIVDKSIDIASDVKEKAHNSYEITKEFAGKVDKEIKDKGKKIIDAAKNKLSSEECEDCEDVKIETEKK